uniref:LsmAD domain-containing protein n=1 Tax=Ascaris lumbricoides TaxID=6252 RepID=A0A0M3HG63_ASCLU
MLQISRFATDQEYHGTRNGLLDDSLELSSEFEVWEADGEDGADLEEAASMKSGGRGGRLIGGDGWSVDEMFNANNALGVKSTFEDNLSQYTTANVEGDGEARLRAERIAQEIETNPASRMRARMENDDEERDLNKETPEFQMHSHRRTQNTASRSSYAGSARGGGNTGSGSNRAGSQASTRRSDAQSSIGRA